MGLYLFSALIFWQKMWGEDRVEADIISSIYVLGYIGVFSDETEEMGSSWGIML